MAITAVSPDLIARLQLLFREIGLDQKLQNAAIEAVSGKIGTLAGLSTTEKSTVVGALNELATRIAAAESATSALIDDTTTDTDTTWSSTKIAQAIAQGVSAVVDGAPAAMDTLAELAAAFQNNPDAITNIMTILGKVVRVDSVQAFSAAEKAQGRANLGAASDADLTQLAANVGSISGLGLIDYTDYRDGVRP
jgi:Flp pilus assembly CpaE family ATPase